MNFKQLLEQEHNKLKKLNESEFQFTFKEELSLSLVIKVALDVYTFNDENIPYLIERLLNESDELPLSFSDQITNYYDDDEIEDLRYIKFSSLSEYAVFNAFDLIREPEKITELDLSYMKAKVFKAEKIIDRREIPPQVIRAFDVLANDQRGRPEEQMRYIQREVFSPGIYNQMIEHIGDLTHRMAEEVNIINGSAGFDYVRNKISKVGEDIIRNRNIEREIFDQFERDYNYAVSEGANLPPMNKLLQELKEESYKYARYHSDLTVYNEAQFHARESAVNIGLWYFDQARVHLSALSRMINQGPDVWSEWATRYELDESGRVIPYDI